MKYFVLILLFFVSNLDSQSTPEELIDQFIDNNNLLNDTIRFVSFPDFFNFDIPEPWPKYDTAINYFLTEVKKEDPNFVLIDGDIVDGRWWDSPECVEHMGTIYYSGFVRRMEHHDLKYFTAVGDHELGGPDAGSCGELVDHAMELGVLVGFEAADAVQSVDQVGGEEPLGDVENGYHGDQAVQVEGAGHGQDGSEAEGAHGYDQGDRSQH